MMAFTIKMRFPLLLLLGVVFLALVCASSSSRISSHEGEEGLPPHHRETGGQRERAHQEGEREEEERRQHDHQPPHHQSHEREQPEEEEEDERQHRHRPQHKREQQDEEDEGRQPRLKREQEPEEEEEEREHRRRRPQHGEREEEKEREHRRERHRGSDQEYSSEEEEEDEEGSSSEYSVSRGRKNPFYFSSSNRYQTVFKNENGRIRLLERLDKRNSNLFQNLQKYRLAEFRLKPRTLLLPQHIDADLLLVVLKGKAILTVVNQNDKNSFNLEIGDAIQIPSGTLAYLVNRDNRHDLKVVQLVIPVNNPTLIQTFFPSRNQNQQSYLHGFSRGILEASFNTNFEEIERVLLQEEQQRKQKQGEGQGSQEANIIVKVSRELIEELSKDAKSSSTKPPFSKSEPFQIESRPIYSNEFGRFSEITSNETPQLQDLDLFLSLAKIKEGALFLPHHNSRASVILVVTEGRGNIELVGVKNEGKQQENSQDEGNRQVQRFSARLTPGDVFIIPSSHPVAVNASSNLSIVGFGINAENNQRNFLAGEEDNVIRQIHEAVKELAFPGSAQEVDRLIKNQRQSYFANAQPQQREEGSQRKRVLLSSILGTVY